MRSWRRVRTRAGGWLAAAAAAAVLAACAGDDGAGDGVVSDTVVAGSIPAPTGPDSLAGSWAYTCPDGTVFGVRARGDSVEVEVGLRSEMLARVPSASGSRYAGRDVVFWSRGREALLEVGSEEHAGCRGEPASSPWERARLMGIAFRALGQEPGWILDIHPERWIRYIGDYGETRLLFPATAPVSSAGVATYRVESDGHELMAVIREEECRDAMSGHRFSHTVAITVDGRELRGCGRRLAAGDPDQSST